MTIVCTRPNGFLGVNYLCQGEARKTGECPSKAEVCPHREIKEVDDGKGA